MSSRTRIHRTVASALCLGLAVTAAVPSASAAAAKTAKIAAAKPAAATGFEAVTLPSATSPLVTLRLVFRVGSIDDPAGKEGLAQLTALMVAQGGTTKHTFSQMLEALYPMSVAVGSNVDREVTVFNTNVHRDTLDGFTQLFTESLLSPSFSESDFSRNREQLVSQITNNLRGASDELLGLEALQDIIFAGHPYGHPAVGTLQGLKSITLDDVRGFYRQHYTRANLILGVAGGYPASYVKKLEAKLAALPAGTPGARKALPPVPVHTGHRFTLIEKQTSSVGIHFGFPLPVNRADADYYPLLVANSFLGDHRSFNGKLITDLRIARGLNYGDYSYIDYWANPPQTTFPSPNIPRRQQYFSEWIRPVFPGDAQFALRAGLYELQRMHDEGLTAQEFEATRNYLIHYSKLWAQTQSSRLGFKIDSKLYGAPYYIDEVEARLKTLTLEQVNQAIKKYLSTDNYDALLVTSDAKKLQALLEKDDPSPKKYNAEVAPDILEVDKTIQSFKVKPTSFTIVPIGEVFEK